MENPFDDQIISNEERAKIQAEIEAAKEARKNSDLRQSFEINKDLFDNPETQREENNEVPQNNSNAHSSQQSSDASSSDILDDTLNKLKSSFNIDDDFANDLKQKKDQFAEQFKEKYKEIDEKAEAFNKKADQAANEAIDYFFDAGQKAVEKAKDMFDKGRQAAYDLEEKMRLKDEAAEAELKNPKHQLNDSLLGGFDSFFDKAKDFADRLEKKVEDRFKPGEEIKITQTEASNKPKSNDIFGFEDLDGDGDPLVDDAIVEE